jgi:iron complex outermembrane receptor protein
MQKTVLLLAFICILSCSASAQQYSIAGTLKDNTGKPIATATISLLKASDSSWIRSEFTGDSGSYAFKSMAAGEYLFDVAAIGYKQQKQKVSLTADINNLEITIQKTTTTLNEVTVTDKKPFIEQGLGKTIINVATSVTAAGSNVLDLLRKSPGITIDMNGNITMQGKQGVLVLIDNKETYLTGQQLADYLRTLSGSEVAQLELITQPSARYDAQGNAGIINIKTKKNKKQGWNGVANASYHQGIYPGTINSISIEHTKGKLHLNASYSFLHMTGFEKTQGWRNIKDEHTGNVLDHFNENARLTETFEDNNLKFGAEYKVSDKTTIDASITGIYHTNTEYDRVTSGITDANNVYTFNDAITNRGFLRRNVLASCGYRHDFNKDNNISVTADYLNRDEHDHDDAVNTNYDAQMHLLPGTDIFRTLQPSLITAYTIRADYSGQLKNNIKIEAGAKSSYVTVHDNTDFSLLQNNVYVPDTTRTNYFTYSENINALYITANKKFGTHWETQAGLRCENNITTGNEATQHQSLNNNKTALFPTFFAAYTLNSKNRFEFNIGRRINRPAYTWLNPSVRYLSPYNYESGNPALQPEYSNNIELKHTYNNHLTTTCSYGHASGLTSDTYHIIGNAYYKMIENLASGDEASLSITYNAPIYKWWSVAVSGFYSYNVFKGALDGRDFNISGTDCHLHINNQFSFEKGWTAEATYFYAGQNIERFMTYEEPRQWLSLGFAKKLFHDTTVIRVAIEDPFNSYVYTPVTNWYNLDSRLENRWDNRQVNLNITYSFGTNTNKHKNHDAPEEAGRMGM